MNPRWKVVLRDVLSGAGAIVAPGFFLADRAGPWAVPPILASALLVAWLEYRAERGAYPDWLSAVADRPDLIAATAVVSVVVLAVPPLLFHWLARWYLAVFVGAGVGLVGHRVVYGVLRPIPDEYLERVRSGG